MTEVAIAIPTLLAGPMLDACLQALDRQIYRDFEVIIVNNGENTIGADSASFGFPLRILSPGENVGFGAAVNLAIRATKAPLIATLNDDTEADPAWLESLVREIASYPRCGMCASSVRLSGSGFLDSAGMLICFDGSSKQRGGGQSPVAFASSDEALLPSACAALYRREMLEKIGLFDEDFFLYCEDTDLGLRARWAGWRCHYAAGAIVRHRYSATAREFSTLKARLVERNRLWVAIKNFPLAMLLAAPLVSIVRYAWQLQAARQGIGAAAEFVRSGETLPGAARILAAAHWETLIGLRLLLAKRRKILRGRKIAPSQFIEILNRHRITSRDLARA